MQTLIGLAPLVAFFVAYKLGGIYLATAALMVVMALVLAIDWLRERKIPPVHALSGVLVLIFGTATLVLHNSAFIQWKPTVLFWIIGLAFLGSFWIGERTLTERFLAPALEDKLRAGGRVASAERGGRGVLRCRRGAEPCGRPLCERGHLGELQALRAHDPGVRVYRGASVLAQQSRHAGGCRINAPLKP